MLGLRQPVRIESRCGSVQSPLRAGPLLLGAIFLSYRDLEVGFRHAKYLIVELGLELRPKN